MRILILGGTAEASALAERLAARPDFDVLLSLAGRTARTPASPIPTRIGGFGGADGLARWLEGRGDGAVIDATHPFAAVISHNAARPAREAGVPILALRRPPWRAESRTIGGSKSRHGRCGGCARRNAAPRLPDHRSPGTCGFHGRPQHSYLVRTIEPVGADFTVPNVAALRARGPFDEDANALSCAARRSRCRDEEFRWAATYAKIAAARALGLPVVDGRSAGKPDGGRTCRRRRLSTGGEGLVGQTHGRAPPSAACRQRAARRCPRHAPGRARPDDQDGRHVGRNRVGLARGRIAKARPGGPTARANTTGVSGARRSAASSSAAPSCHGRAEEIGL